MEQHQSLDALLLREALGEAPEGEFRLAHVERLGEALSRLGEGGIDVVLLDLSLPDGRTLKRKSIGKEIQKRLPLASDLGAPDRRCFPQDLT